MQNPLELRVFASLWNAAPSVNRLRLELLEEYGFRVRLAQLRALALVVVQSGFHLRPLPRFSPLTKSLFVRLWNLADNASTACYDLRWAGCKISRKKVFRLAAKARLSGKELRPLRWKCATNHAF